MGACTLFWLSFSNINILYTVLAVIWLYESVYRCASHTSHTCLNNKKSRVCTFCLYSLKLKDCSFNLYLTFFHDLIRLVIVEKIILVRAKETQMLAILWSRGPIWP